MGVTPFADLPITEEEQFDPDNRGRAAVENDILGDPDNPNWERYKKAHLWFDPDQADTKAGYKFIIARMVGDQLTALFSMLGATVAVLNSGEGDVPTADRRGAFNHAMRYYTKLEKEHPDFEGGGGRRETTQQRYQLPALRLQEGAAEGKKPKWQMVAVEGEFNGYANGERGFAFTREIFDQVVANLRAHPSYLAGPDGVGRADVIPWDFSHASERPPTEGVVPIVGSPAQGWTMEFEVRTGAGGRAELWALTRWLEPARTYIANEQYQWASVALIFDAVDPVSGEHVGAVVTSIALTNQPFIEGMTRLAAMRYMYFDPAADAEQALDMVRDMFGLPSTADAAVVMSEVAKLRAWVVAGTVPVGVDADNMVGALRTILNLPALSTVEEVFAEAEKLIGRLLEQRVVEPAGQPPTPPPPEAGELVTTTGDESMDLKVLAGKLGVKDKEEAVAAKVDALLDQAAQLLGLLKALGADSPQAVLDKVADLEKAKIALEEVAPELETLRAAKLERDAEDRKNDVAVALQHHFGGSDSVAHRDLLTHYHEAQGREAFLTKFPAPPPDKAHLTKTVAAGADGGEKGVGGKPTTSGGEVIDLARYPGRNKTEKIVAHVRATVNGADQWNREQLYEAAWSLGRTQQFINE
jgi:hypothetical protein